MTPRGIVAAPAPAHGRRVCVMGRRPSKAGARATLHVAPSGPAAPPPRTMVRWKAGGGGGNLGGCSAQTIARPGLSGRSGSGEPPDGGRSSVGRLPPPRRAGLGHHEPPCATLCHLGPLVSDHLVPLCATLCRRRPEWTGLKPFRASRIRSSPNFSPRSWSARRCPARTRPKTRPVARPSKSNARYTSRYLTGMRRPEPHDSIM